MAILIEGDHGHLFDPGDEPSRVIDLHLAISQGGVVVFSLNSSTSPETAQLLGAAIFQDLKHVAGVLEANPAQRRPAAVVVDEFGAFGSDHVVGLFQRARSAKLSLHLLTQELADLKRISPAFCDQVVGNVETIVAHRQNVPESAELVAELAGTREVWIHTFQTRDLLDAAGDHKPLGSRRRGHEFHVAPDTIKALGTGHAIVITKNPHRVHRVGVYPPSLASANPFDSPPVVAEQRLRVHAYDRAHPEEQHLWAQPLDEQAEVDRAGASGAELGA